MGAINYGNNRDFGLTLGYNLGARVYNPTAEQLADWDCESEEDYERSFYLDIEDCWEQINFLMPQFKHFNISLESGYYEGFWIAVDLKWLYFNDYKEKLEALKEATKLKAFLLQCVEDFGCVAVDSGWVSTYYSKQDTIKALNKAIRDQKAKIKAMKTDKTLTRQEWRKLVGLEG